MPIPLGYVAFCTVLTNYSNFSNIKQEFELFIVNGTRRLLYRLSRKLKIEVGVPMNRLGLYFMVLVLIFSMIPFSDVSASEDANDRQAQENIAMMATNYSQLFFNLGSANGFQDYLTTLVTIVSTTGYTNQDGPFKIPPQSFLLDKTKTYTWMHYQDGVVSSTTAVYSNETYEEQPEWDMWKTTTNGKTEYILVKETEEGLYSGFPYSHYYADLKYPLYAGKVWDNADEQADLVTYTVVATDRIVTIQAGTFENVVEVKTSDGWIFYYAPNIGLIMSIDGGIVVSELSSLQDE